MAEKHDCNKCKHAKALAQAYQQQKKDPTGGCCK